MLTDKQVRGKLVNQGVRSLSDAELLSILLQKGEAGGSALELAERLLEAYDHNLMRIALDGPGKLRSVAQLGIARAALVSAALEIGRRGRAAENSMRDQIMSDRDVIELFQPELAILPHEEFWVLYLNASNKILDRVRISQGGVTGTVVDYKLIVKRAVERRAQSPFGQSFAQRRGHADHRKTGACRIVVRDYSGRPCHYHVRRVLQFSEPRLFRSVVNQGGIRTYSVYSCFTRSSNRPSQASSSKSSTSSNPSCPS